MNGTSRVRHCFTIVTDMRNDRSDKTNKKNRKMAHRFSSALGVGIAAVLSMGADPAAAEVRQNVGTLTCTVEPSSDQPKQITCRYHPTAGGAEAKFTGEIARLGADQRIDSNRVLVWMVLGVPEFEASDLEAKFVRKNQSLPTVTEGAGESLVGGVSDSIALVPPSGREQIPGNAAITVLELDLSALKV